MLSQQTNLKIDSDPVPENTSIAGNGNTCITEKSLIIHVNSRSTGQVN